MDGVHDLEKVRDGSVATKGKRAYLLPTFDLCVGVDAWDMAKPSCIMGDEGGFRDEQGAWRGTALRIVGCLLRSGDMGGVRSVAGQRGKDDAVLKRYPADLDGLEERGCLLHSGHSWRWSGR